MLMKRTDLRYIPGKGKPLCQPRRSSEPALSTDGGRTCLALPLPGYLYRRKTVTIPAVFPKIRRLKYQLQNCFNIYAHLADAGSLLKASHVLTCFMPGEHLSDFFPYKKCTKTGKSCFVF